MEQASVRKYSTFSIFPSNVLYIDLYVTLCFENKSALVGNVLLESIRAFYNDVRLSSIH